MIPLPTFSEAAPTILRARTVVTMAGPPLADGAVVVRGQRITAVGRWCDLRAQAGAVVDLGEQVLLPGLINAHCHLDYTMMRHAIDPPKSFTAWVQRINALKRSLDAEDYRAAIVRGFAQLQRAGTTTVCNIEAFPELMLQLGRPSPIRTWWFYEMIDVRHRITTDDVVAGGLSFFEHRSSSLDHFGLSPHAPYTASTALYGLANSCASTLEMPLTTHLAESAEELAMFRDARGPLYQFMNSIQRPMTDCGRETPFALLWKSGAVNRWWMLVHLNELTESDFELLGGLPQQELPTVVHCPGSHRYFHHSPFAYRQLRDLGTNICIATDSLASTETLCLFDELRTFRKTEPAVGAEEALRLVTVNPARALQRAGLLGEISAGAYADLIALPASANLAEIYEEIVAHDAPVSWMMIDGQTTS